MLGIISDGLTLPKLVAFESAREYVPKDNTYKISTSLAQIMDYQKGNIR